MDGGHQPGGMHSDADGQVHQNPRASNATCLTDFAHQVSSSLPFLKGAPLNLKCLGSRVSSVQLTLLAPAHCAVSAAHLTLLESR